MIFAREVSGPLTSLVKQIDAATAKNSGQKMGSFVVFCSDAEGLEKQLKELVAKEKLKDIVLAIDNSFRSSQVQSRQGRRGDRGALQQAQGQG